MAPSTVRACVMAACMMTAVWLERKNSSWNSLLLASVIILIFSPRALYDVGFQLSFTCVAGLIFFAAKLNPIDRHEHNRLYSIVALPDRHYDSHRSKLAPHGILFRTPPIAFLPTNLLILPLLPVLYLRSHIHTLSVGNRGEHPGIAIPDRQRL